jgi:SAM-dependent methyltransferase
MKNEKDWRPSKFTFHGPVLRAARDPRRVGLGSRLTADRQAKLYQQLLLRYASGHLLDLGCGSVPLFGVYRPRVEQVTCVDWPQSGHNLRHVDVFHDLNQPLPLPDETFDTVLLTDVMEHVAEPTRLWAEIARVLRPGGRVISTTPFLYVLHETPHDYYRYTCSSLHRHATQAGLDVELIEPYGGSPEVMADLLGKHVQVVPTLCRAYIAVVGALLRTPPVRRLSERTRQTCPLGYAVVARRAAMSCRQAA